MIQIALRPDIPPTLESEPVLAIKNTIKGKADLHEKILSSDFNSSLWRKDDILTALKKMHHGKCCYCERKRDMKRESDVEHFRPKAEVYEVYAHPGYWWLGYDWSNYLYSCKTCNQSYKLNHFPLINEATRAYNPGDNLDNEDPLLINPAEENPEDFISFEWAKAYGLFVKAVGTDVDGRGHATITITGINEGEIPKERAELVNGLAEIATTMKIALRQMSDKYIEKTADIIKNETSSDRTFAGFKRAFFKGWGLGEYVSTE